MIEPIQYPWQCQLNYQYLEGHHKSYKLTDKSLMNCFLKNFPSLMNLSCQCFLFFCSSQVTIVRQVFPVYNLVIFVSNHFSFSFLFLWRVEGVCRCVCVSVIFLLADSLEAGIHQRLSVFFHAEMSFPTPVAPLSSGVVFAVHADGFRGFGAVQTRL